MAHKRAGMTHKHRECLRMNYTFLLKEIMVDDLCDSLREDGVVKEDWIDDIRSRVMMMPMKDRVGDLLEKVKCSGPKAWDGLLSSLENTNQKRIAWRLRESERLYEENQSITAQELKTHFENTPTPLECSPTTPEDTAMRPSLPSVASISSITNDLPRKEYNDHYKMESNPRGCVTIINNYKFEEKTDLQERLGSKKDRDRLKAMFESFGFAVQYWDNLKAERMKKKLAKCASPEDDVDCVVIAILSHGKEDAVYGVDGTLLKYEEIIQPFKANNSPKLKGKPKLFILQACRGRDYRMGLSSDGPGGEDLKAGPSLNMQLEPDPVFGDKQEEVLVQQLANMNLNIVETKQNIHPLSDMVLAYSTLPDHLSMRDDFKGSWFVQALCNIFTERAKDTDVLNMLSFTNNEILRMATSSVAQCPQPRHTLRKIWNLNPI